MHKNVQKETSPIGHEEERNVPTHIKDRKGRIRK